MSDTKWVVSKYAPETGERFEVAQEYYDSYMVRIGTDHRSFLKREYIPCPPPERWERVPIEGEGCRLILQAVDSLRAGNERFRIIDGALVLERKVT